MWKYYHHWESLFQWCISLKKRICTLKLDLYAIICIYLLSVNKLNLSKTLWHTSVIWLKCTILVQLCYQHVGYSSHYCFIFMQWSDMFLQRLRIKAPTICTFFSYAHWTVKYLLIFRRVTMYLVAGSALVYLRQILEIQTMRSLRRRLVSK